MHQKLDRQEHVYADANCERCSIIGFLTSVCAYTFLVSILHLSEDIFFVKVDFNERPSSFIYASVVIDRIAVFEAEPSDDSLFD